MYLGVSDGRAFMDHDATIPFEVLDKFLGCGRKEYSVKSCGSAGTTDDYSLPSQIF